MKRFSHNIPLYYTSALLHPLAVAWCYSFFAASFDARLFSMYSCVLGDFPLHGV